MASRGTALLVYTVLLYATLPWGPAWAKTFLAWPPGAALFGPGLPVVLAAGTALVLRRVHRRGAGGPTYAMVVLAALGYTALLFWLRAVRVERVHLLESAVATGLALRFLRPLLAAPAVYAATWVLASAIGVVDELLQLVVPGRVCDPRDMLANSAGVALSLLVFAALAPRVAPPAAMPREVPTSDRPETPSRVGIGQR